MLRLLDDFVLDALLAVAETAQHNHRRVPLQLQLFIVVAEHNPCTDTNLTLQQVSDDPKASSHWCEMRCIFSHRC